MNILKILFLITSWEFYFLKYIVQIMGTDNEEVNQENKQNHDQQTKVISSVTNTNQCFFYLGDTENGKKILQFFQGIYYSIFITIITLITLFLDDVRVVFFTVNEDVEFSIITVCCMFFFFIEMIAFSFVKENYFMGYYFWLDLVSTLTMILDLTWINQVLTGGSGLKTAASVAKVARASRASKIGAKATKLIRIIRLIRFLKLYKTASKQLAKESARNDSNSKKQFSGNAISSKQQKLSAKNVETKRFVSKRLTKLKQLSQMNLYQPSSFQAFKQPVSGSTQKIPIRNKDSVIESNKGIDQPKKQRHTQNLKELAGFQQYINDFNKMGTNMQAANEIVNAVEASDEFNLPNQTNVGTKLKDEIQKNIITMILMIIISIPLFNAATWNDNLTSYEKGIAQLETVNGISSAAYDSEVGYYIDYMNNLPAKLIYFDINLNSTCCSYPDSYPNYQAIYKISDSAEYRTEELLVYSTDAGSVVIFQSTSISILTAQLNIGRTLFVCVVLIVSTLLFSRDVEIYALEPLENMFDTVKRIAISPLNAIREIQEKKMCIETLEGQFKEDKEEQTQPNLLENLIVKIGGLLAVGFGQAGTEIISRVIQDPNFVNVIIPGEKVMGIYGFCDIRNFTDATEILEADVMVFVNEIAEICHKVVNVHCGSPNKNIGDAFLLVWKYEEKDLKYQNNKDRKNLELADTKRVKQIADLAVLSFVKMIAEINKSYALLKYKNNKDLKSRIKNYQGVKMGFGLHVGWSIEGPIGSEYKVDASYLSPSVNMASRLEAATKQYNVPMLITEDIYNLMTENKKHLRKVDRVMFAGYDKPTDLYTVDLNIDSLLSKITIDKSSQLSQKQKKYSKIKENIRRNKLLEDIETKFVTKDLWAHQDVQTMKQRYSKGFYEEWENGFNYYVKGDWEKALASFNKTKLMAPDQSDGPSENFIEIIESHNRKAPEDWQGFREVDF